MDGLAHCIFPGFFLTLLFLGGVCAFDQKYPGTGYKVSRYCYTGFLVAILYAMVGLYAFAYPLIKQSILSKNIPEWIIIIILYIFQIGCFKFISWLYLKEKDISPNDLKTSYRIALFISIILFLVLKSIASDSNDSNVFNNWAQTNFALLIGTYIASSPGDDNISPKINVSSQPDCRFKII